MQRELRDLESRHGPLTHYQLLGVPADADSGAIRRAYLEKSKRFHPDAWYRKELGSFGPLLSTRSLEPVGANIETTYRFLVEHVCSFLTHFDLRTEA